MQNKQWKEPVEAEQYHFQKRRKENMEKHIQCKPIAEHIQLVYQQNNL